MAGVRQLIVNADDFGLSRGINEGVVEAYNNGIVTSASLHVRGGAAAEAAEWAKSHPELSLGLHIDLGEWAYVAGQWLPIYEVVPAHTKFDGVEREAMRQVEAFQALTGHGPTHIDSRQHRHQHEPLHSILRKLCQRRKIPLRQNCPMITYWGYFHGQTFTGRRCHEAIGIGALLQLLKRLPAGCVEMNCHPAKAQDFSSRYRAERVMELRTLCAAEIRGAIAAEGVRLISFHQVGKEIDLRNRDQRPLTESGAR